MKRSGAAALALLLAGSVQAQAPDPSRPLKVAVEAVAAEVEVLVIDRKGRPVDRLERGDFRLFVNGKETPIDWFEVPPALGDAVPLAPAADPAGSAAVDPPDTPPTTPRHPHSTVFIISALHVDVGAQEAGLDALRAYVDRLPPDEPASVYLLDNGARRLAGFTSDRQETKKALDRTRRILPPSYALDVRSEEWVGRSRQTLRNLGTVLDGLASRPEPKTVVMLTGPLSSWGTINPFGGAVVPAGPGANRGGPRISPSPLNATSAVTSYNNPVAARGERQWSFLAEEKDVENQAFLARATIVALDPSGIPAPTGQADAKALDDRPLIERDDSWEFRNDTFALIADATGGARLGFSNKPADLLTAEAKLLARRYRLGFTPPDGTSARRDIRVEVARPGLVVRTASGQRSLTAQTAARARFAGLLLSAEAPVADFAIAVEMKSPNSKRTEDALPLDVLVPVSAVYAEERGESTRAELELLVSAVDDEGRASEPKVIPFSVEIARGSARDGAFFRKSTTFSVDRRWKGRLFVGVRDTATNRLGAVAVPIGG